MDRLCCHCRHQNPGIGLPLLTVLPHLLPQTGLTLGSTFQEQSLQVPAWLQPDSHTTGPASASLERIGPVALQVTDTRSELV